MRAITLQAIRRWRSSASGWRSYSALIEDLARLPGFRNVLLHEYVELDLGLAVEALDDLEPLEEFLRIVSGQEIET